MSEDTDTNAVVVVCPVVVHLKRSAKSKSITQGCTYWIGPRTKFNGVQLPASFWCNPFPDTLASLRDGRYQSYIQTLLQRHPEKLAELSDQVLGCVCRDPPPPQLDVTATAFIIKQEELLQTFSSGFSCPGQVLIELWKQQYPSHTTMPPARVTAVVAVPTSAAASEAAAAVKKEDDRAISAAKRKPPPPPAVLESEPPKQRQRKGKALRTQKTHPLGLVDKASRKLCSWPLLKPSNDNTAAAVGSGSPTATITSPVSYEDTIYLDEAGRGALAGPMTIGAVVLLPGFDIEGLHDSKLLTEQEREHAYDQLVASPFLCATIVSVSHASIDEERMGKAWPRGMVQAIEEILARRPAGSVKYAVLDGDEKMVRKVRVPDMEIIPEEKGDRRFVGIAAAAILAKVARDRLMVELSLLPAYAPFRNVFGQSKAYGTEEHRKLITKDKLYTDVHRRSFDPLESCIVTGSETGTYPLDPPCCATPPPPVIEAEDEEGKEAAPDDMQ